MLKVDSLKAYFLHKKNPPVRAVDDVSFEIAHGETVAIVGESGCGKSTLALSLFRLLPPPGKIVSGQVWLNGSELLACSEKEMRKIRGRQIGLILQDSLSALNPVMRVGAQIAETIRHHFGDDRKTARHKALEMMERVTLPNVTKTYRLFPHQLSGGQRQRIAIALALACQPKLLVADEPTTALDVSLQSQILALLHELKNDMQLSILLITHDLGIVSQLADRMAVMYAGKIVEQGTTETIFSDPLHPYTISLLEAVPRIGTGKHFAQTGRPQALAGAVPDLQNVPSGCAFHPRCPQPLPECNSQQPQEVKTQDARSIRCFNLDKYSIK